MDRFRVLAALGVLSMVVVGCGEPQKELESGTMGANGRVGDVLLRNVFVEAPPEHAWRAGDDASAWLTLLTEGGAPDALVGVRTDSAARVELLADRDCDGEAEPVDRVEVPAGGAVDEQGSVGTAYRLRITDFTREVLAGTTVPLTFTFEDAGETTVEAPVEASRDGDVPPPPDCAGPTGPTSATTASTRPETVLRGRVQEGVESGCLVLTTDQGQFLLLGGDPEVLRAGAEVVVEGAARPDQATTCQQGTPFTVREVRQAPATR